MAGVQISNNAVSTLAGSINTVVTSLSVQAGHGARFPAASVISGNYFYVTLIDSGNNLEIVKVTDRTADVFTIIRARDGTTARSFIANDRVELRPVAAMFNELPNRLMQTADYADLSVTVAKLATMGSVTPNTYGGAGRYLTLTVNAKGLVTGLSEANAVLQHDTFDYTGAGQTWTKPVGRGVWARIQVWGGGGSGGKGRAASAGGGGGGGGYNERWMLLSDLGATETVTVGQGAASQTSADSSGSVGGTTTFGAHLSGFGGGGGRGTETTGLNPGGGGGGWFETGQTPTALTGGKSGSYRYGSTTASAGFAQSGRGGDSGGASAAGDDGNWGYFEGGGGGGSSSNATTANGVGGNSYAGGGGGGAGAEVVTFPPGTGGISIRAGNGGAGAFDASNATAGAVPSGGGGGSETGNSGAGGHGRCVVTVF